MPLRNKTLLLFWIALIVFLGWDWLHSAPINHRLEPPVVAVGSGQAPTGGHCSAF
jgi:hypothetical protein